MPLTSSFARPFAALALSAAMALSPMTAAPARAENIDELLAGLAALAIIGTAIANDRGTGGSAYTSRSLPRDDFGYRPHREQGYHSYEGHRPRRALPARCLIRPYEQGVRVGLFPKHCLEKHYGVRATQRLPLHCQRWVHTRKRAILGYAPRCLRRAGYVRG